MEERIDNFGKAEPVDIRRDGHGGGRHFQVVGQPGDEPHPNLPGTFSRAARASLHGSFRRGPAPAARSRPFSKKPGTTAAP